MCIRDSIRMTTPAGEDVEFDNAPGRNPIMELGYSNTPGSHMMAGQIGWSPDLESINGVIVFDGSLVPPCIGVVKTPVALHIKAVSYTHLRAHETRHDLVCRLLLEK